MLQRAMWADDVGGYGLFDAVPGARLRVRSGSISTTNIAENAKRFLHLRAEIIDYLCEHNLHCKYRADWYEKISQTALSDMVQAVRV